MSSKTSDAVTIAAKRVPLGTLIDFLFAISLIASAIKH
jgi:hypothetical protein